VRVNGCEAAARRRTLGRTPATPVRPMEDNRTENLDVRALDSLRESIGGDQEFFAELIHEFLHDAPSLIESLRAAAVSRDAEAARRAAHTLKSHGATFGVRRLEAACRTVESSAQDGLFDGIEGLLVVIEESLADAQPGLATLAAVDVSA